MVPFTNQPVNFMKRTRGRETEMTPKIKRERDKETNVEREIGSNGREREPVTERA